LFFFFFVEPRSSSLIRLFSVVCDAAEHDGHDIQFAFAPPPGHLFILGDSRN
jgi:hypothetical protein